MTYYNTNKGGQGQHFQPIEGQNNSYMQTQMNSPNNTNNNIFVPGSMRFAVMNQRNANNQQQMTA